MSRKDENSNEVPTGAQWCDFDRNEEEETVEESMDKDNDDDVVPKDEIPEYEETRYSQRTCSLGDVLFEDEVGWVNEAVWLLFLNLKEEDRRKASAASE